MANVKYCPMCRKQVSIDTEVCECGYEFSVVNEPETNAFEEFDKADPTVVKPALNAQPAAQPTWIATLALVLSIFGLTPGLVLAIIGLTKLKDSSSRTKCIIAIVLNVAWMVIGFFVGIALGLSGYGY